MSNAAPKSTALWVVRTLRRAGFEALLAGGCVRDMLLGRRCTDYDVATSATPQQVRRLFPRVLLVGAKFGVAMVIVGRRRVEVATFRSDVSYTDGRRPDHVRFTTAREDALRRDFTINGMFYDPVARTVIDYVGGQADLAARVVRTIGRADDRFDEDYLRMLRAVRFTVRLGFALDAETARAVVRHAARIDHISGERIFDELSKMLSQPTAPAALEMLRELGLADRILPELSAGPELWPNAAHRVAKVADKKDLTLAMAALLAELPAADIRRRIRRWGGANEIRDGVAWLAEHLDDWKTAGDLSLAQFKRLMADRNFPRLQTLWKIEELRQTGQAALTRRLARRANAVPPHRVAPPPLVTGADLKTLGLPEGPRLGHILKTLYDAQLNEQLHTRRQAMAMAKELAQP